MRDRFIRGFLICCCLIFLLTVAGGAISHASQIYWTTGGWGSGQVYKANMDGTGSQVIMSSPEPIYLGITWDSSGNRLFTAGKGTIQSADLNGANQNPLVSGNWYSESVQLNAGDGKMYWTTFSSPYELNQTGSLQRSDLDGTNAEILLNADQRLNGLAMDADNQMMYWTQGDRDSYSIYRADYSMTNIEQIVHGDEILNIALDTANDKIYWTDWERGTISRSNLDGSSIEDLYLSTTRHPHSIALDFETQRMYWTEWGADYYTDGTTGVIMTANLDGSNVDTLLDTAANPMGIAIVNPVPVPAAVWLFTPGLLGLIGLRLRKKL